MSSRPPTNPRTSSDYDLVAIDLDGTLVDHTGHVSDANIQAISRARATGMVVVVCTGRALVECTRVIQRIAQTDPVIASGGAMVVDPTTGHTLERFTMPPGLVDRLVSHLAENRHPSLVLKDPDAAGYDYLVVAPSGPDSIDPSSRWWFKHMGVRTRFVQRLEDDQHPEHTIRVGAYSTNKPVAELVAGMRDRFAGQITLQHFAGVLMPPDRVAEGIHSVHILEMFDPQADKWQAMQRLASRLGVDHGRTAAIGDQDNDLPMITNAGIGIAMGNASPAVQAAADEHAPRCEHDGVAAALHRLIDGRW